MIALTAVLVFCAISYVWFDRVIALGFKAGLAEGSPAWRIIRHITDLGLGGVWLVPAGIGAIVFRVFQVRAKTPELAERMHLNANASVFLFASVAGSGIAVDILKGLIGRLRPYELFTHQAYGFQPFTIHWSMNSFPSGHSQTIFAAMTAFAAILPRARYLFLTIAVVVVASRVILSVHYLSDVVMGAYCGIVGTILLDRLFTAREWRIRPGTAP